MFRKAAAAASQVPKEQKPEKAYVVRVRPRPTANATDIINTELEFAALIGHSECCTFTMYFRINITRIESQDRNIKCFWAT